MPSQSYTVTEKNLLLKDRKIWGRLYRPNGMLRSKPTVILSHGFGGTYRYVSDYAEALAQVGYLAYAFDFRGGGPNSQTDGKTTEMSVLTEVEDLDLVVDQVRAWPGVDTQKVVLLGESQGGLVSALVGAHRQQDIQALILLYPALVIEENYRRMAVDGQRIPSSMFGVAIGPRYYYDALQLHTYQDISLYHGRTLILHGDQDDLVPLNYSRRAVTVMTSSRLEVLHGAGHGFYGTDQQRAIHLILQFLEPLAGR